MGGCAYYFSRKCVVIMSYANMAMVYDQLMKDAPYAKWVEYVKKQALILKKSNEQISVLDVGCGTGELAVRLKKDGFHVSGTDLSETMLTIARQKAESQGLILPLFQQDMTQLQVDEKADIITIFCDSINYLPSKEAVASTFHSCYAALKEGGLLLLDAHSPYKIDLFLENEPFYEIGEEVTYIWSCSVGKDAFEVIHDLTFFVQNPDTNEYQRFDEWHHQKTFPIEDWNELLLSAGFTILSVTADFTDEPPNEISERFFFCVQK